MNMALVVTLPLGGALGDALVCMSSGSRLLLPSSSSSQVSGSGLSKEGPHATKNETMKREQLEQDLGFQRAMKFSLVLMMILVVPAFVLICSATLRGAILGQGIFVLCMGLFGGNLPAFMASMFEAKLRYSGIGIGNLNEIDWI